LELKVEKDCAHWPLFAPLTLTALPGAHPPRLLSLRPTHTSVIQLKHTTQAPDPFRSKQRELKNWRKFNRTAFFNFKIRETGVFIMENRIE